MWFNALPNEIGTFTGGTLFGAIDKTKFTGDLVRVPNVIEANQVGFYVNKPVMTYKGVSINSTVDTTCLVDSGSHEDTIPIAYGDQQNQFFAETGLVNYVGFAAWNGTCDTIPVDLTFDMTFAGATEGEEITIKVPLRNYARGAKVLDSTWTGGDVCVLNLDLDANSCLLGAPFSTATLLAVDDADNSIAFARGGVSEVGSGVEASVIIGAGETYDSV